MNLEEKIKSVIRDVPDFPKPGILFKDITPIMLNPDLSNEILNSLCETYQNEKIDKIAGIESRGFLFGYAMAMKMGIPFVLIRKKGKLPYDKLSYDYELEYGSATIEIHTDAILEGERVLIHDDLLATGGSAGAAAELVKMSGGEVAGFNFLVSLDFLDGEQVINKYSKKIVTFARF